jgi:hypothetical protein
MDSKKLQEDLDFKKRQTSFQGFAMYSHEVLMSLQTRAKFFGAHFLRS